MYNKAENIPTNADSTGHWKALYAGAAGDVKVDMFGNDGPLIFTMVAGGLLPVRITKVYGDSDTDITNGKLRGLN